MSKLIIVSLWAWASFLVLSLIPNPKPTFAKDNLFLTTTLGSYHFERPNDYCETNPGVGLKYFFNDNTSMGVGTYKNSPCNQATYLMGAYETNKNKFLGVGVAGGIVSGYDDNDFATQPLIAYPYIRVGSAKGPVHATVLAIPHPEGLVGFALQWKLN